MEVILSPSHSHCFLKASFSVSTNKRSFVLLSVPQNLHGGSSLDYRTVLLVWG